MARRYESKVRDEQANRTRAALLEACEALLLEGPVEEVTLPAVARRAGVTKPTAYHHFPDNDALLAGFLVHLRDRIGMAHETLASLPPRKLPAAVRENYRRFDANAELLRRIMNSPSYDRVRLAKKLDRAALTLPVWGNAAPERVLRERIGPVYLLLAPASWRWLCETWGLSGDEAARAAEWAVTALVSAISPETRRPRARKTKPPRAAKKREKRP
jgi:AcrR family transcriptional regulator